VTSLPSGETQGTLFTRAPTARGNGVSGRQETDHMATQTIPTFTANCRDDDPAFVITYPHEDAIYVVGFDSLDDLMNSLVGECLDGRLIELIIDFAEESLEWNSRPPVAEAVCDCELCRSFPTPRTSNYWYAVWRVGVIAAPWVALALIGRWVAARWGNL
jgi:hypothetical protein